MSKIACDLGRIRAFVFDVDGVLSPNLVQIDHDGVPTRMANVKDGYAMQLAVKRGYRVAIISGADSESVRRRYELLGIKDVFLRASEKLSVLCRWIDSNGLLPEEVMYAGDDMPDLTCMGYVGLAVAPADASVDAIASADYVSPYPGGHGVARDIIEQTMRSHGTWTYDKTSLSW